MSRHFILILAIILIMEFCALGSAETFLVTSDLHLTEDREAHEQALDALRSVAEGVDAVIFLGDSTNNAHPGEHTHMVDFLMSLNVPAYVIPGNHDVTLDISEFIEMYADYGWSQAFDRDEDSASCAVFTEGGTCLLLLDTNDMPGYVAPLGGISEATCAWVSRVLSALPDGTPVFACGHHPILPEERWSRTPGAGELAKALGDVKLYLCGHDHGFGAIKLNGLQQITVGQPYTYPGWAGLLEVTDEGFLWRVLPLYSADVRQTMRSDALALADGMARGTLKGTTYEDDEDAVRWFVKAFEAVMTSRLDDKTCEDMLGTSAADKWREIETKTAVKRWIIGLLENCPQDVRRIDGAL